MRDATDSMPADKAEMVAARRLMDATHAAPDRPVHRPRAWDAPVPGIQHYSGCDDGYPRVRADGVCEGCGERACAHCGYETCDCDGAAA